MLSVTHLRNNNVNNNDVLFSIYSSAANSHDFLGRADVFSYVNCVVYARLHTNACQRIRDERNKKVRYGLLPKIP